MKLSLVLLSLSVCFLVSTAYPSASNPLTEGVRKSFGDVLKYLGDLSKIVKAHSHRMRRQSGLCAEDLLLATGPKFMTCTADIQALESGGNLTFSQIADYCVQKCSPFLIDLANKLAIDCGIPDATANPQITLLLYSTCYHGPKHVYCGQIWNNLGTSVPADYSKCFLEFNPSGACPNSCKSAELWTQTNIGCCYQSLANYLQQIGNAARVLTSDFWLKCGLKEPDACIDCEKNEEHLRQLKEYILRN